MCCNSETLVITGDSNGVIYVWLLPNYNLIQQISVCRYTITFIDFLNHEVLCVNDKD